ncbi:MAG: hypothetical protein JWM91_4399 [Rhodospirillales bacterium]|nr:hypothetical protein [Rhodospirillales bacterium]
MKSASYYRERAARARRLAAAFYNCYHAAKLNALAADYDAAALKLEELTIRPLTRRRLPSHPRFAE